MLTKLKFSNINSFKEEAELNFEFNGKTPENIKKGRNATNVLCIKGANSSGKTNIFKVLDILSRVCGFGAKIENNERLYVDTYFFNSEPAKIYVEFTFNNIDYKYSIELSDEKVLFESLFYKSDTSRFRVAYERENDAVTKTSSQFKELNGIVLKPNSSVIALLSITKFSSDMSILDNARRFFSYMIINVGRLGHVDIKKNTFELTEKYRSDDALFNDVKKVITLVDDSIKDIVIKESVNQEGKVIYYPLFVFHKDNKEIELPILYISSGIRKLYEMLEVYFLVRNSGGILALDEFDIHLHPHLIPVLLALFDDTRLNVKNAQIIVSTHNTEIIDVLGKYRVVIVNKVDNESVCYRLDELIDKPLRNDRNISSLYIDGKLGGIPEINGVDLENLQMIMDV